MDDKFMLQSLKEVYEKKLGAKDGEIGHVKDFYFDDHRWVVRYVVANTGTWLTGRQVLISPHAFGDLGPGGNVLEVKLTRKQIEGSPDIGLHKPVSRQYEEEYFRHYSWPHYWEGDGLWGGGGFPVLELPVKPGTPSAVKKAGPQAHLRSAQAVTGYHIKASDGTMGHICDFMMDRKSWAILGLVVKTGHRFSGKEVQIPTSKVSRVSYEESMVYVDLTCEAVEKSPAPLLAPA